MSKRKQEQSDQELQVAWEHEVAAQLYAIHKEPILVLLMPFMEGQEHEVDGLLQESISGRIHVIVNSPGGSPETAYRLARLIRLRAEQCRVYVPYYAKSAASLLCLAGDEIVMSDVSELGPLDIQVLDEDNVDRGRRYKSAMNHFRSVLEIRELSLKWLDLTTQLIVSRSPLPISDSFRLSAEFVAKIVEPIVKRIDPLQLGSRARQNEISVEYGTRLLTQFLGWPRSEARKLLEKLTTQYPSHGFVLDRDELEAIGLNVVKPTAAEDEVLAAFRRKLQYDEVDAIFLFDSQANKELVELKKKAAELKNESSQTNDGK